MIVFSPHYDDAVFSCGAMLAERDDVEVITACTEAPPEPLCTEYDRATGFATSTQAMSARFVENRTALAVLGAREGDRLGWYDQQYAHEMSAHRRAMQLQRTLSPQEPWLAPLGIMHPDHRALSDAVLFAWDGLAAPPTLWLYEDLPYRVAFPEFTAERIAALRERLALERLPDMASDHERKGHAVACYRSQLPDRGPGRAALFVSERFWKVER